MATATFQADTSRGVWSFLIVGALLLVSALYYRANPLYMYINVYIWFGFAYGMVLQWGHFCFASAFRDLFAMGITRMFVGIMIAMGLFSLLIALLEAEGMSTFHPGPLGLHEVAGGLIFGAGMVFAGGCASGTLYKCGEGNANSMIVLLVISFSQAIFVDAGGWFDSLFLKSVFKLPKLVLSDYFPALGASKFIVVNMLLHTILPSLLLLVLVYVVVARKNIVKRLTKANGRAPGELEAFWNMIQGSSKTALAGLIIGVLAGGHILAIHGLRDKFGIDNFGEILTSLGYASEVARSGQIFDPGYWYITTQEAQFAAWIMERLGLDMRQNIFFGVVNGLPALWRNPALLMSGAIVLGAAAMALINNEFRFKKPSLETASWSVVGGTLMGLGARVALGCNIGAFFIRVAGGDPGGWLFALGMAGGVWGGLGVTNWWTNRQLAKQGLDF
jgi:uncharacterized protein